MAHTRIELAQGQGFEPRYRTLTVRGLISRPLQNRRFVRRALRSLCCLVTAGNEMAAGLVPAPNSEDFQSPALLYKLTSVMFYAMAVRA